MLILPHKKGRPVGRPFLSLGARTLVGCLLLRRGGHVRHIGLERQIKVLHPIDHGRPLREQFTEPFFVVATQNPSDQIGTFPLPESQLDRFLMRLELGYPDEESERALIMGRDRRQMLEEIEATLDPELVFQLQHAVEKMHISEPLVDYVQALVRHTRESPDIETGLSPRGSLALIAAAKAHAFILHHSGVFPDDIQAVFAAVAGHRLKPASGSTYRSPGELSQHVLDSVAIP